MTPKDPRTQSPWPAAHVIALAIESIKFENTRIGCSMPPGDSIVASSIAPAMQGSRQSRDATKRIRLEFVLIFVSNSAT